MVSERGGHASPHQSPTRSEYSHHKSLSGSSNDLLRLATQNHGNQQNLDGERERIEPYKSVVSPTSTYASGSLSSSDRYSYMDRNGKNGKTVPAAVASASPSSQRTFMLTDQETGTALSQYSPHGGGIGESPKDPLPKQKKQTSSSLSGLGFSTSSGSGTRNGESFHGFWSNARPEGRSGREKAGTGTSFSPVASDRRTVGSDDMDFGFTFPVGDTARRSNMVNIQDLVKPAPQTTFLDLTNNGRNGSYHNRSHTEPAPSKSLFTSRLFANHKDAPHPGGAQFPVFRQLQKSHAKSASMCASPSISAPYGLSIAAYRPVPTHSTAAHVSMSLAKPDLQSLDQSNAVLLPAGPSHMQKQVEDLESRRMTVSRMNREGDGFRAGTFRSPLGGTSGDRSHPVDKSQARSALRPVAAISEAQMLRGGDQPVNWMRTGLSRSASQEAVQMLQPTRWEARNGCEQLVLPRPKLVAHAASPPATPEQVQRARAFFLARKGKEKEEPPAEDVIVIDRQTHGVTFESGRTASPALSGFRVMDEGAERERERQEWARSVATARKRSIKRPRSNSLGSRARSPRDARDTQGVGNTYFGLPRSPGSAPGPAAEKPSPPVSTSFGFLSSATESLRSRSRSATGSSRKTGGNSPRQFGSTSTGMSFRNAPQDHGSIGGSLDDPFAVPIPHTPSRSEARLSRNHSSPDLRRVAMVDPLDKGQPGSHLLGDNGYKTGRPTTPLWFEARTNGGGHSRQPSNIPSEAHSQRLMEANEVRTRYLTLSEAPILGPEIPLSPARPGSARYVLSPAQSSTNSPLAERLPAHTARALASRLSNSPRKTKSSLEEAVIRARSSAVLMYGEDPESFASAEQVQNSDTGPSQNMTIQHHREILEAAGILPQHPARKYLTPVTEANESARSTSSPGNRSGSELGARADENSPVLLLPRKHVNGSSEVSPAMSEASPWPRRPIDEMDQYDQELFFARPRMAWSSPLAYPVPDSASQSSPRSQRDPSNRRSDEQAVSDSQYRTSRGSTISHMLSTPTTGGDRASQDVSAENGNMEVATPVLAYEQYGWTPDRRDGLDMPFEMRVDAASPEALDRQASQATLRKDFNAEYAPWTRENSLFQGSPYQTQTEDGSDGEFVFRERQSLVHKSSSDSASLHVGTVPSATPAHRSPSMDQLTSNFERRHLPRASVVPEVVVGGSPTTYIPSQPSTPNTGPGSSFVLPQFESDSSLGSGRSIPQTQMAEHSAASNTEIPTRLFLDPNAIASLARDFPAPPTRSNSYPSTLSSVYPEPNEHDHSALAPPTIPWIKADQPILPPMKRLDTDFSAMTGNSYVTATEGYETDDNA